LEQNISELQTINNRLQKESSQQKKRMEELETQLTAAQGELQKAREQSSLLGSQLKELERTSIRQEESLRIANESLTEGDPIDLAAKRKNPCGLPTNP